MATRCICKKLLLPSVTSKASHLLNTSLLLSSQKHSLVMAAVFAQVCYLFLPPIGIHHCCQRLSLLYLVRGGRGASHVGLVRLRIQGLSFLLRTRAKANAQTFSFGPFLTCRVPGKEAFQRLVCEPPAPRAWIHSLKRQFFGSKATETRALDSRPLCSWSRR